MRQFEVDNPMMSNYCTRKMDLLITKLSKECMSEGVCPAVDMLIDCPIHSQDFPSCKEDTDRSYKDFRANWKSWLKTTNEF